MVALSKHLRYPNLRIVKKWRDWFACGGESLEVAVMKISQITVSLACSFAALFLVTSAGAAVVVAEYFDYGPANVTGTGTAAVPFSGQPWVTSGQTSYRANENATWAGAGYSLNDDNNGTGSLRYGTTSNRGTQLSLSTGLTGEFWVTVLMRTELQRGALSIAFNNASGYQFNSSQGYGFGVALHNGQMRTAITEGSGLAITNAVDTWTSGTASTNFHLLVARVLHNPLGVDTIDVWTYGNSATVPTTGLGTPTLSSTGNFWTGNALSNVVFMSNNADGSIDALRISNLSGSQGFNEAMGLIPEPSTGILLSLAFVFVMRRMLHPAA